MNTRNRYLEGCIERKLLMSNNRALNAIFYRMIKIQPLTGTKLSPYYTAHPLFINHPPSYCSLYSKSETTLTVILLVQQRPGGGQEDFHQLRHPLDDSKCTEGRFFPNVCIGRAHQFLHLAGQIASHLRGRDGPQGTQCQPHHELCRTVEVTEMNGKSS